MHASRYQGYRFPPIIIQHAVWVYRIRPARAAYPDR